jgi:hypothetical protein
MRLTLLLILFLPSLVARAQTGVWQQVHHPSKFPQLPFATLTKIQEQAVARIIQHCCQGSFDEKHGKSPQSILRCIDFQQIPLADKKEMVLISEDETECFQPGTSDAVPMWIARLDGDRPVLLSEDNLFGSLYSVEPTVSKGYHDLILYSHFGAGTTLLTYFQFNGKFYESVSQAMELCDDEDRCRIDSSIPAKR